MMAGSAPVAAQDARPASPQPEFPLVPDEVECDAEPVSAEELLDLWYTPEGPPIVPPVAIEDVPTQVTLPVGPPADDIVVSGVTTTILEVFSCFEAGDVLRAYALFTDDLAIAFGPGPGVSREEAQAVLEAPLEPEDEGEQSEILAVTDVMQLEDGRVGAFVVDRTGRQDATTAYVIFEPGEDWWLVDEVIEFSVLEDEEE